MFPFWGQKSRKPCFCNFCSAETQSSSSGHAQSPLVMHFQFKLSFFGVSCLCTILYIVLLSFVTMFDPSLLNWSLILTVTHMEYIHPSASWAILFPAKTANKSKPCPLPAYLALSWVPSLAPCYIWIMIAMYQLGHLRSSPICLRMAWW